MFGSNVIKSIEFPEKLVRQRLEKGSDAADHSMSFFELACN